MSVLGMSAFSARDHDRNGLIVLAGAPTYQVAAPPDSLADTSLRVGGGTTEVRRPWYNGETTSTPREPSGDEYWFHYRVKWNANVGASNANSRFGVGRNGARVIAVSAAADLKVTLEIGSGVVATATVAAYSVSTYERLHVHVGGHLENDVINVYMDGDLDTPILSHTIDAGQAATLAGVGLPNEHLFKGPTATTTDLTDLFAIDPNDGVGGAVNTPANFAEASIEPKVFTGNGTYTAWTGDYTDIDEIPNNDADAISVASVDQASTFTKGATAAEKILSVQSLWRVTRTGTDAGSQVQIRMRSGVTDEDEAITAAPGDGDVIQQHHDGVAGAAWTPAEYDATEFGPVSRT